MPPPFGGPPRSGYPPPSSGALERIETNPAGLRRKSLVLYGATRLGKTVWARSLGKHLYFCGLYSYAEAIRAPDAEYAVFDDIQGGLKFFHGFKNWLGCQYQFQVKGLYRDPQLLDWGKPCIWVANTDPRHDVSEEEVLWLEGNCTFVHLQEPIAHANTE